MPNTVFPAEIGIAEVRSIFNILEKEASNREKDLMDTARQIVSEEELLDALYLQYEDLDTDFRRAAYSAESTLDKLKLFKERNDQIVGEVALVETDLPMLSSSITRFPLSKDAVTAQDIFINLERLLQKEAFLMEGVRRLEEHSDSEQMGSGPDKISTSNSCHQAVTRHPMDPVLLKISEAKVLQSNLEWELSELEDQLRQFNDK